MSKKNIFLLAAGYVAGGIIASLYNKKRPADLKKALNKSKENGEGEFKIMFNNFIDTHTNLLEDLKTHVVTDKNKELFNEKKEELFKVVDSYKVQATELAEELKGKGKEFLTEASDTLEKLYDEKKEEINTIKGEAPKKIKKIGGKLKKSMNKITK